MLYSIHRQPTYTLFTTDTVEYNTKLYLKIDNTNNYTHPQIFGVTLDPKLAYNIHIVNITTNAHTSLEFIRALNATTYAKQREMLRDL